MRVGTPRMTWLLPLVQGELQLQCIFIRPLWTLEMINQYVLDRGCYVSSMDTTNESYAIAMLRRYLYNVEES